MITIDFRYLELNADKYRMLVNKLALRLNNE